MYSDAYVLTALRRVGVPSMYIEDALQEVRILEWRTNPEGPQALHNIAISALRKLPGYTRVGHGFRSDSLSAEAQDFYERTLSAVPLPLDDLMDAERTINALPLTRRRAFALLSRGFGLAEVSRRLGLSPTRIGQFRRELRGAA